MSAANPNAPLDTAIGNMVASGTQGSSLAGFGVMLAVALAAVLLEYFAPKLEEGSTAEESAPPAQLVQDLFGEIDAAAQAAAKRKAAQ